MGLSLNTNLNALAAQRSTGRSQNELSSAIARLSSGLRINSARDDAAGMAIADRFTAQIRGTNQASRNANDAISLSQTAESALGSVSEALQRIRELAVQSANATNSASDRAALQQEVAQLVQEVDRVSTQTQFNGISLLDGSFTAKAFQVGANAGQTITVAQIASARTKDLGVAGPIHGFTALAESWGNLPFIPYPLSVTIGSNPPVSLGNVAVSKTDISDTINNANLGFQLLPIPVQIAAGSSSASATGPGTAVLTINNVAISVSGANGAGNLAANRTAAVNAINAQSASTGVTATNTGAGVSMAAADGRPVVYTYSAGTFTGSNAADFGLINSFFGGGTFDIVGTAPVGVTTNMTITYNGVAHVYALSPTGQSGTVDVSTVSGANAALLSVDAALSAVAASRASLGAISNRFASTLQTLHTGADNLAAARSRIQDADFAMETANLTRAQVLQEAGTAMIAQANQLPQQVLALLR